jgi:hypothetical protein
MPGAILYGTNVNKVTSLSRYPCSRCITFNLLMLPVELLAVAYQLLHQLVNLHQRRAVDLPAEQNIQNNEDLTSYLHSLT